MAREEYVKYYITDPDNVTLAIKEDDDMSCMIRWKLEEKPGILVEIIVPNNGNEYKKYIYAEDFIDADWVSWGNMMFKTEINNYLYVANISSLKERTKITVVVTKNH